MKKRTWYPLDNAANIYPVTQNKAWTSMFRLAAVMRAPVDTACLQAALDKMRPRFPGFYVRLRRGAFWFYLEECDAPAKVQQGAVYICARPGKRELLFRVLAYETRIALEVSHILCDGGGALVFFKTLLAQYLRELGVEVAPTHGVLDINAPSAADEWEDSFERYARAGRRPARQESYAYHPTGTRLPAGMQHIVTGVMALDDVLSLARLHKVSLTEYLTATLVYVLYKMQQSVRAHKLKPVKVSVPVNLRKYYKTNTLRNFSQYLNPGIDPALGDFTFEETLEQVHHYFRYMFTEKNLNARMSQNVDAQRSIAVRAFPLFLKRGVLRLIYEVVGEQVFSSVISNMGAVVLPAPMQAHIERVELLLGTALHNAIECGVVSMGNVLCVSFTRKVVEPYVERMFFRMLVQQGIHVLVESNMS